MEIKSNMIKIIRPAKLSSMIRCRYQRETAAAVMRCVSEVKLLHKKLLLRDNRHYNYINK
jgi:hypothetical protein